MRSPSSTDLQQHVSHIADEWLQGLNQVVADGHDTSQAAIDEQVRGVMDDHLAQLSTTGVWGADNRLLGGHVWRIVGPVLQKGSLQLHAREKPLGYAGDFRLLERICGNDCRGQGLALGFDEYFQQHPAPKAVRNRATMLAAALAEFVATRSGRVQITSFGSGPAYELRLLCAGLPSEQRECLTLTLLDIDPHALEFATSRLREFVSAEQIQTHRVNLARLPKLQHRAQLIPHTDFLYASGFFDYLQHADAVAMIRFLWQRLRAAGSLFVFNFCQQNPSRAYMEWVANWYLTYRSDEDMRALAVDSQLPPGSWTTDIEPAGVNRFLSATKS